MYDLAVIGAGVGGYEAAAHAGAMGKKVILFEKNILGGTCLNVGCIPTKTLLKSAKVFGIGKESAAYGVAATVSGIDMAKVQERKNKVITTLRKGVEGLLKKSNVEVVMAEAKIMSEHSIEASGKTFDFTNLLIATGSSPAKPPIPGIDSSSVLDSTGLLNLSQKPESLVIIGGGIIGLEFACFFSEIGTKVTVIEMLPNIATGIDTEISGRLLLALKKMGITFYLSCKVTKIDGNTVAFTDPGGAEQKSTGNYILISTGRTAFLQNIGLEKCGIKFDKKGIHIDDNEKTNVDHIWACGDVTGKIQLAHVATRQGIVAVNNMFGHPDVMKYDAIPSVVYTHPEIGVVGKTEDQLKAEGKAYKKVVLPMGLSGRFIVENEGKTGTIKVLADPETKTLLGVHIIGDPASEIIFGAAAMIESGMKIAEIAKIVFPHPTVSEILKEAVNQLVR